MTEIFPSNSEELRSKRTFKYEKSPFFTEPILASETPIYPGCVTFENEKIYYVQGVLKAEHKFEPFIYKGTNTQGDLIAMYMKEAKPPNVYGTRYIHKYEIKNIQDSLNKGLKFYELNIRGFDFNTYAVQRAAAAEHVELERAAAERDEVVRVALESAAAERAAAERAAANKWTKPMPNTVAGFEL